MKGVDTTKRFWSNNFLARLYRKRAGKHFQSMHQQIAARVLAYHPKAVLDVACGPGDFLFLLSQMMPTLSLSGTDIAPGMVSHAAEKLAGRATVLEAAGGEQPFPPASFDVITIMMAFHHFPDKGEVLGNLKKLLKPSGKIVIVDIVARSNFQKKVWNIGETITSVRGYVGHYTEKDLHEIADRAGLSLTIEPITGMPRRYNVCILSPL